MEEEAGRSSWIYTAPKKETTVATRGYIFAADQLCMDLNVGREEYLPQLTFRPVYKDFLDIKYKVEPQGNGKCPKVIVFPRLFSFRFQFSQMVYLIRKIQSRLPGQ